MHLFSLEKFFLRNYFKEFWVLEFTLLFLKIYIFTREREHTHAEGGGQRERERQSEADSMLRVEPEAGLDPTTLRSGPWAKAKSHTQKIAPPRCPTLLFLKPEKPWVTSVISPFPALFPEIPSEFLLRRALDLLTPASWSPRSFSVFHFPSLFLPVAFQIMSS